MKLGDKLFFPGGLLLFIECWFLDAGRDVYVFFLDCTHDYWYLNPHWLCFIIGILYYILLCIMVCLFDRSFVGYVKLVFTSIHFGCLWIIYSYTYKNILLCHIRAPYLDFLRIVVSSVHILIHVFIFNRAS